MIRKILLFNIVLLAFASAATTTKKITLVTHETSPFMDERLPDQGALISALRHALKKMNYELDMFILGSWTRTKIKAVRDEEVDGYAPYATKEHEDLFIFSDYCYEDPWVIVERKDNPIQWKVPEDLLKYKAGNVLGVEFRPGIKPLVDAGKLTVVSTGSVISLIRLLATKRVDFIFIDQNVFRYHMTTNATLSPYNDQLQINPKVVAVSHYGLAIKKGRLNAGFMKEFNKQCKGMTKDIDDYLENLEKKKN